jgi:transcriptional accessory protein Tex/SPT6
MPSESSTVESLRKSALPLRNILATVRNIVDFGVFVDIGLENDGLLHRLKMGDVSLDALLVGQEIGVHNILGVGDSGKIGIERW